MVSQKMKEYIEKTRKAGFNDEQIKETLKNSGWSQGEISKAMGDHSTHMPPPAPEKVPGPESKPTSESIHTNTGQKTNTLAIIAFILIFFFWPASFILGLFALGQIKKTGEKGKGLAIAAIASPVLFFLLMVLIASFAYFGVLDPARMLPERCQFPAGMDCIDKAVVTSDTITVALRNNIGFGIKVNQARTPLCTGSTKIDAGSGYVDISDTEVSNNGVYRIQLTGCNNGRSGKEVDTQITVDYTNVESGLQNSAIGDIRGKVS